MPRSCIAELCHRVRRSTAGLLSLILFLTATGVLIAQQDDPSEIFLKAYLSAQQGEKLEHENRFKTALAKYRFAGSLIETLRKSHAGWQPAVVDYRGRKISEGILRIQETITKQNALSANAAALPEIAPALADGESWSEPGSEVVAPQSNGATVQTSGDGTTKSAKAIQYSWKKAWWDEKAWWGADTRTRSISLVSASSTEAVRPFHSGWMLNYGPAFWRRPMQPVNGGALHGNRSARIPHAAIAAIGVGGSHRRDTGTRLG